MSEPPTEHLAENPRRRTVAVVVGLLLLAVVGGAWGAYVLSPDRRFRAERDQVEAILVSWRKPPPRAFDPDQWEAAWGTVFNAFGNVCFTEDHVSIEEMVVLRQRVLQKDEEPQSMARLEWMWQRLAETGPHGKRYITQMQPPWDDVMR